VRVFVLPLCSSFAVASDSVSMPEPTLTCKGLLHKLFYTPTQARLTLSQSELTKAQAQLKASQTECQKLREQLTQLKDSSTTASKSLQIAQDATKKARESFEKSERGHARTEERLRTQKTAWQIVSGSMLLALLF
ncbi:MAG: hypothetical protein PUE51_03610, partial [Veillonellaceae bacterium]|nr:hypothetical protein [Veillonellaceae bacterium]